MSCHWLPWLSGYSIGNRKEGGLCSTPSECQNFYLFRFFPSSVLLLRIVGRSNFDNGRHNLATLIKKTDIRFICTFLTKAACCQKIEIVLHTMTLRYIYIYINIYVFLNSSSIILLYIIIIIIIIYIIIIYKYIYIYVETIIYVS